MPAVSVIIPVFNRAEALQRAVDSVLTQESADFELIVIDDGSTESLASLEAQFEEHPAAHLVRTERQGVAAARNAGIRRANGEWLAFLDSDDFWLPGKLTAQLDYHVAKPDMLVSQVEEVWYRHGKRVNKKNIHEQPAGEIFASCLERCSISPSSVMLHRSVFSEVGCFAEELPACEDYELWLRVASQYQIALIRKGLVVKHGGNPDQLSQRFAAMDRFRVYSIVKVLAAGLLDEQQEERAIEELVRKLKIIEAGGSKRQTELGKLATEILRLLYECEDDAEETPEKASKNSMQLYQTFLQELHSSWEHEFQEFLLESGSR